MQNDGSSISARPDSSQQPKRNRLPSSLPTNEELLRNSSRGVTGRPTVSPPRRGNQLGSFVSGSQTHQVPSTVASYVATQNDGTGISAGPDSFQQIKRTRSPSSSPTNEDLSGNYSQGVTGRSALFPSGWGSQARSPVKETNSHTQEGPSSLGTHVGSHTGGTRLQANLSNQVLRQNRDPPFPSKNEAFNGKSHPIQDANTTTERELQAKAKRLARFSVELSQSVQNADDLKKHKSSGNRHDQSPVHRRKFVPEHPLEAAGDFSNGSILPDSEDLLSSHAIIGLCPDMCPDSEREERERKGDLDKYERLDGDRNQTTEFLAVKKYNRTAEREADLIRPMPVLQKTVDYLLDLLNQPYDNRFLGMYNFLWDRMRAIRMDLRMQHIFNRRAITMLEQMIRLHIIAMHELCEYTKGEGFSEGFDAHLNIEQMNKTSVELFQMYDDHRKKGIDMPSEKEFRGYYALLKLDKHPGYKVEPAELSLDLAKMTPEIRQAMEVLFAREVARACRTGNFIAFFRLARKATYLQACLMHAHFSKLRTQALASLHSGLQNNQGIPITHVRKWLGMEEEDIEDLLEYHGFSVKEFEESYMFKEGPFLNSDSDYPTKCSKLVHLKRSRSILDDVVSSNYVVKLPVKEPKHFPEKMAKIERKAVEFVEMKDSADVVDEDMPDFESNTTPRDGSAVQSMLKTSTDHHLGNVSFEPWVIPEVVYPETPPSMVGRVSSPVSGANLNDFLRRNMPSSVKEMPLVGRDSTPVSNAFWTDSLERNMPSSVKETPLQTLPGDLSQVERNQGLLLDTVLLEDSETQEEVIKQLENKESVDYPEELEGEKALAIQQEAEAFQAKLKLILRIWKRHSSKRRELREQRKLAADAALNLLSLGPPFRPSKTESNIVGELNIDHIVKERHEIQRRLWSRLNVAEVVEGILRERNPNAKCLCWKLLVCFQMNDTGRNGSLQRSQINHFAGRWLLNKLMGVRKEVDDELLVTLPGVSIWKKWSSRLSGSHPTCCLSVIRDIEVDKSDDTAAGASSVLFLVSESIPLEIQKVQLHNLIMSLPCGSRLPLLILSGMLGEEDHDPSLRVVNGLGLHDMDEARIKSFSIKFLTKDQSMEHADEFFSDDNLGEGLQWLARQSPPQPDLLRVKTREVVLTHLNASLEVLDKMNVSEVSPNHCISVFNEALDQSVEEVTCAADTNPACWPCPEIDMLEESSNEHKAVNWFLPSIGWSSAARVEPIKIAINGCKLPLFPDDLSWLDRDLHTGKEVQDQKLELEKCLTRYLTQSSKMMEWTLAARESNVMVQKGARLVLHDSCYHIVPRWVVIFWRVFNWKLMNLSSGIFSVAYVLEHEHESSLKENSMVTSQVETPELEIVDNLRYQNDTLPPYFLSQLSLDEMIEVGCNSLPSWRDRSESDPVHHLSAMEANVNLAVEATTASDLVEDVQIPRQDGEFAETGDTYTSDELNYSNREVAVVRKEKEQADRLSKLLEHCNLLQDMIDEKLSIYF
ncbi:SAC3 family protein B [Macadamia integrifolia]|uniref:SAC3 family protein B n=1 Tax=Macadamia integrifolia TaxID=60698 RepID=UPI001C4F4E51|nr:SAC3 family protein B [Macadamia integrifolia]